MQHRHLTREFEAGKTYYLPTPYNAFDAAAILAEGLESPDTGKPIAEIVPMSSAEPSWLGCMKDTGRIVGDIVSPAESIEAWEVLGERA